MKTCIKQLQFRGFKSFNRKVDVVFQPGLNCVMGPNGSGKSNVLDGMCFILGRLSSKDLRAENFADLLFKRKGAVAAEGEVSIVLDNSSRIFPMEDKLIEIKRKIKKTGQTQFKINGRNSTRTQALDLLAIARIFPDGHNIILQGDIARFVDLRPLDRRLFIEEIAGIGIYEEKKLKALSELGKVDDRLKEVSIVLREKESYMKNLEEEKKGAQTYRELQEDGKKFQAGELQLKMNYAKDRRDKAASEIESKILEISNIKLDLDINSKKIAQFKDQLTKLEKEIQKKGGEETLKLQKEIEAVNVELAKARTLISISLNEIGRVQTRKTDLELNLASLNTKLKEREIEKINLEKELAALQKQEDYLKKGSVADLRSLDVDVNKLEKDIDSIKEKKDKKYIEIQELKAKVQIHENEIKLVQTRLTQLKASTKDFSEAKVKQLELMKEIDALAREDSKLALELGELRKESIKKEENLTKSRILSRGSQEALLRDTAIKVLKERDISGVYGTVSELGNAKQQYATALSIAAGGRMRNIVVDRVETAIKCLELLKSSRAGVATLLPIDKLKVYEDDVPESILKRPGVLGLAHELIDCEPKYKKVFNYVFRNTLVVQNIATAKEMGVGKYRMVTLDGDLFEPSGAITGGFRQASGVVFETIAREQIDKLELETDKLKEQAEVLESQRNKLESKLFALRTAKAEVDAKAELAEKGSLAKEVISLEKKSGQLEESIKKNSCSIEDLEKEYAEFESKIVKTVSDRNVIKTQLHDAQFGDSVSKLEDLQTRKSELDAAMVAAKTTIENALIPDKESTRRVLNELEKEKKTFEKQISDEEHKVKGLEKNLEVKEKEQQSFQGKLQKAFEEQSGLSNTLRETETDYNKGLIKLNQVETDKNNLAIDKAQHEAELAAIDEEFKPFVGVEPAQFKTLEDAKKKIHEAQAKLESLGNVNMRALEIFEDVLKEYSDLTTRVAKLVEEKSSVLSIIDEVEKKKTEAFMKTFSEINSHFSSIYEKVNVKYQGELELENPEKPFEGGVVVKILESKKKRISVASLSGGERTLVALAFVFAIQEHEPAAFYLLDEIDAALDKLNSEKVAKLLKEYSQRAQVIIISHNDSIISEADSLYGISMNKDGESSIVSLKL
jgi:chromosome segregation protein